MSGQANRVVSSPRLLDLLTLERVEVNLFLTPVLHEGPSGLYGGQVAAQALRAAAATVAPERHPHSLHGYFLSRGDASRPVLLTVDQDRDGRSYSNRRVIAVQEGKVIFNMAASFHVEESGYDHQTPMPPAPDPDRLGDAIDVGLHDEAGAANAPPPAKEIVDDHAPLQMRNVDPATLDGCVAGPIDQATWLRLREPVPDDPIWRQVVMAYMSDLGLIGASMRPHSVNWSDVYSASLDHALWFHRPFDPNDWLLYTMSSPSASGGRGFNLGSFFTRTGVLAASAAQEGLIRPIRK